MEVQIKQPTEPGVAALAFLGDAIYELYMRRKLVESGLAKAAMLSRAAASLACATKQAELARLLEPFLTEEEMAFLRRGRNAKTRRQPRGDVLEYRMATGLEALLGHLYTKGRTERLEEILALMWRLSHE